MANPIQRNNPFVQQRNANPFINPIRKNALHVQINGYFYELTVMQGAVRTEIEENAFRDLANRITQIFNDRTLTDNEDFNTAELSWGWINDPFRADGLLQSWQFQSLTLEGQPYGRKVKRVWEVQNVDTMRKINAIGQTLQNIQGHHLPPAHINPAANPQPIANRHVAPLPADSAAAVRLARVNPVANPFARNNPNPFALNNSNPFLQRPGIPDDAPRLQGPRIMLNRINGPVDQGFQNPQNANRIAPVQFSIIPPADDDSDSDEPIYLELQDCYDSDSDEPIYLELQDPSSDDDAPIDYEIH